MKSSSIHGSTSSSAAEAPVRAPLSRGSAHYSPYGIRTGTGTTTDIGYTGAWTDPTSGLDYLRARDYDPDTAQFLQVDPAVDRTREPYAYAGNDPLNAADPTGLCVGIDGSPQDRACTQNDFFWNGLGPAIAKQWTTDTAGFRDGIQFGVPLLFNGDVCRYGSDASFWVEYGLGAAIAAATLGLGAVAGGEEGSPPPSSPAGVKPGWVETPANNGGGVKYQDPFASGNANQIRIVGPTSRYPNGYVRFYNSNGQPIDLDGKPTGADKTHIPINPDGSYPVPNGW